MLPGFADAMAWPREFSPASVQNEFRMLEKEASMLQNEESMV